jgi:hypothetical protein
MSENNLAIGSHARLTVDAQERQPELGEILASLYKHGRSARYVAKSFYLLAQTSGRSDSTHEGGPL